MSWRRPLFTAAFGAAVLSTLLGAAPRRDGFRELPVLKSRDGVLTAELVATPGKVTVDGVELDTYVFNGEYGGPVLSLNPGDKLRLKLVNRIDKPINLHFHGLHDSPLGHGDNVFISVKPGASFDYRLEIPRNQPSGLYWYHTHVHGLSEEEVNRGLSGALIIGGAQPFVADAVSTRTRLMVLKTYGVEREGDPEVARTHGVVQSINGEAHSQVVSDAGSTELWRLSNQSPNDYFHLSATGFKFRVVGVDGAPSTHDLPVDRLDIPPAGTLEVLATIPAAGDYSLLSGSTPTGSGRSFTINRELARIHVMAASAANVLATPPIEGRICSHDLRSTHATGARVVVFGQKPGEETYLIDGKTYDHHRIDARIALGSVEDWTIRNDTDDMHVFHIHQLHFQVLAINGQPQPYDGVIDVVRVPERGSVTIRIPFTDPHMVGRFVYHCHVLKHEDKGMMANIEVFDPRKPGDRSPLNGLDEPLHAGHG